MRITVVLPTYNEAENLPNMVSALLLLPVELGIVIVDDNSPDGTGTTADDLAAKYPGSIHVLHRTRKLGLRSAYVDGFRKAFDLGADAILQMDADFSHDPAVLPEMMRCIGSSDVVVGSRYIKDGSLDNQWPIWRKALSTFGNFYARTILNSPIHDMTTGFRLWRREVLQNMPLDHIRSSGYIFQVEMTYVAWLMGYQLTETPIHFADRRWGKSKMSLRIQLEAAVRIWDVWFHYRDLRKKKSTRTINT